MTPILSTDNPAFSDDVAVTGRPDTHTTAAAVPEATVAPLDYQLEPKPVSRRHYRRVLWLCGAGWVALALVILSYGMWRVRMIAPVTVSATPARVATPATPVAVYQPVVDDRPDRKSRIKDLTTGGARSANTVVYEEDPVAAGKLLSTPTEYGAASPGRSGMSTPQGYQPPAYIRALDIEPNGRLRTTEYPPAELFRGGLVSPAGNQRLVRIVLRMRYGSRTGAADTGGPKPQEVIALARQLAFQIYRTDSDDWLRQVRGGDSLKIVQPRGEDIPIRWVDGVLRADRAAEHNVRFYAGQVDPKDPSHFTIDYELNGARDVIDGWLTDDDYLRIRPRGGKVTGGDWRIDGKP